MGKLVFKILAVIMILGLVLGALGPVLVSLGSNNSQNANEVQTEESTQAAD
jgi:type II secretory pathway pseudopilin PulG